MLIYDCEITKAILGQDEERLEGIEYCEGWRDFEKMGISVIGVYDYYEDRYRLFCRDNFYQFQELVDRHELIVGFNSLAFDNRLCAANGIKIPREKSYDILVEIWKAAGLSTTFEYPTHLGYGLEACCEVNFAEKKSGHGAKAPVLWQQMKLGHVIDYCLNDVRLEKRFLKMIMDVGFIVDPKYKSRRLKIDNTPFRRYR